MNKKELQKELQKSKELGWCLIPPYIMEREDLSMTEKAIFGRIMGLVSKKGYCWASNKWLAGQLKVAKSTAANCISKLVGKKLLKRELVRDDNNEVKERKLYIENNWLSNTPTTSISDTPITPQSKGSVENKSVDKNSSSSKKKKKTNIQLVVNHLFSLKGWDNEDSADKQKIRYSRHTRPAKNLLTLCDNDVKMAKNVLTRLKKHAEKEDWSDWTIETVLSRFDDFKKDPQEKVKDARKKKTEDYWKAVNKGSMGAFAGIEKGVQNENN